MPKLSNASTQSSEIIIILDRSGSMSSIKSDVEGAFKTFLSEQKKEPGECLLSLYEFDDRYEAVYERVPISTIDSISVRPRGNTALLDAIGKTVNDVGARLAKTTVRARPDNVIVVAITDGQENASREFGARQIRDLVEHQQSKYSWKFIFLGSNQDAVLNGQQFGFSAADSMTFGNNTKGIMASACSLSSKMTRYRVGAVSYSFSDDERTQAMGSKYNSSPMGGGGGGGGGDNQKE